ncbi:TMhelix containing protein [Vibrio phage 1.113.A._10N.286.51.E7]|nr:TMhelix containing protein [Vibrio phage 1.113.A._10N.286.51.E7]
MKGLLIGSIFGGVCFAILSVTMPTISDAAFEQTKTFKVSCKSFDYDGEVFRDGKKFYELVGGKEIWIPLGDCLLREVE